MQWTEQEKQELVAAIRSQLGSEGGKKSVAMLTKTQLRARARKAGKASAKARAKRKKAAR